VNTVTTTPQCTEDETAENECSRWLDTERVTELAKANAAISGNLERLASEPDLQSFMGHVLLEATRQLDAAGGAVLILKDPLQEWRILAYVEDGEISKPNFPVNLPCSQAGFDERLRNAREPLTLDLDNEDDAGLFWPGTVQLKLERGLVRMFVLPLVFGERTVGCISLSFRNKQPISRQARELLIALGHQATLAIELTRHAHSAKEAAVLAERNRISQEIHDGLAQAFTGILMQLGATEEFNECVRGSRFAGILDRIRDLAKEGLAEARRSVLALRPSPVGSGGLSLALGQLAERSTVPGRVLCTYEGPGSPIGLSPEHKHELLRIAQEAVSNALRHAQPSSVQIMMKEQPAHWELAVADDGIGFETMSNVTTDQGFGLTNMRERAQAIGGEWLLESEPGQGTRVLVRLPKRQAA
jgi:signal transduction histidine kinase